MTLSIIRTVTVTCFQTGFSRQSKVQAQEPAGLCPFLTILLVAADRNPSCFHPPTRHAAGGCSGIWDGCQFSRRNPAPFKPAAPGNKYYSHTATCMAPLSHPTLSLREIIGLAAAELARSAGLRRLQSMLGLRN